MYYAEFELDDIDDIDDVSIALKNLADNNNIFPVVISVYLPQNRFRNYIATFEETSDNLIIDLYDELRTLKIEMGYTCKVSLAGGLPFSGEIYHGNQTTRLDVSESEDFFSAQDDIVTTARYYSLPNDIPLWVCCPYTTNGGKVHVQIRDRNCLTGTIYNAWIKIDRYYDGYEGHRTYYKGSLYCYYPTPADSDIYHVADGSHRCAYQGGFYYGCYDEMILYTRQNHPTEVFDLSWTDMGYALFTGGTGLAQGSGSGYYCYFDIYRP